MALGLASSLEIGSGNGYSEQCLRNSCVPGSCPQLPCDEGLQLPRKQEMALWLELWGASVGLGSWLSVLHSLVEPSMISCISPR